MGYFVLEEITCLKFDVTFITFPLKDASDLTLDLSEKIKVLCPIDKNVCLC